MAIEDMLGLLGHEIVAIARRLGPALELAAQADFDVAMLDVNLDGEMSFPVADLLIERGVPFFFATGYGRHGIEDRYDSLLVLQKPFRSCDLAEMFQALVPDSAASSGGSARDLSV